MSIQVGKTYVHYKQQHVYTVVALARMEKDPNQVYVVYRAEYNSPDYGDNATWLRPIHEFSETVVWNGVEVPRFKLVDM
jgi:hypothetical protein